MEVNKIIHGNCLNKMKDITSNFVDLIYCDPPFYTQKNHSLSNRDNNKTYEFSDKYNSITEYLDLIEKCLVECNRILKDSGSIFLHCDKSASHNIRTVLDKIFGRENFQSEIVWSYKRWSNSKKGLLNSHQIIFFYSKTKKFKFNTLYTNYSATTNIDQILQKRERTKNGKSTYKKNLQGKIVLGDEKKGVPLSDVWEIPFLNPKAKERCGYPTQKPVLLLNQILNIATNEGDIVLDPFCGSGTTCVSAKSLNRNFIGIDISIDAVHLSKTRLSEMIITNSLLLENGVEDYIGKSSIELELLNQINAIPVQRNNGIDGFLKQHFEGIPVPVKIQNDNDSLEETAEKLEKSCSGKDYTIKIIIQTKEGELKKTFSLNPNIKIIKALYLQVNSIISKKNLANKVSMELLSKSKKKSQTILH